MKKTLRNLFKNFFGNSVEAQPENLPLNKLLFETSLTERYDIDTYGISFNHDNSVSDMISYKDLGKYINYMSFSGCDDFTSTIEIELNKIPENISSISVFISLYKTDKHNQNLYFENLEVPFVYLKDIDNNTEIFKYDVSHAHKEINTIHLFNISRVKGRWVIHFRADESFLTMEEILEKPQKFLES